jgi:hypothetical protein
MTHKILFLAAGLIAAAAALPSIARPSGDAQPFDPIPMAPRVVYDISGPTLGGMEGYSMVIYSNGRVQVSQIAGFDTEPYALASQLSPDALQRLLAELGSWSHLKDETQVISDLPLKTLTVIDGAGRANSVSWWDGQGGHDNLEQILGRVVQELFIQVPVD